MDGVSMAALIGKRATFPVKGMDFYVRIINVKQAFGRVDVQITPVEGGGGSAWVSVESVRL